MSRRLLILSTVLVLGGLLLMAYSDPAVTVALGGSTGVPSFTATGTRTFAFNSSRTFTFNGTGGFPPGQLAGGVGNNVVVVSTNSQLLTFVGVGVLVVGLLLEVFTLFLWQSPVRPTTTPEG